jgi:hypothetical protein
MGKKMKKPRYQQKLFSRRDMRFILAFPKKRKNANKVPVINRSVE